MLYKVVLSFESVDEIVKYGHSNGSYSKLVPRCVTRSLLFQRWFLSSVGLPHEIPMFSIRIRTI